MAIGIKGDSTRVGLGTKQSKEEQRLKEIQRLQKENAEKKSAAAKENGGVVVDCHM